MFNVLTYDDDPNRFDQDNVFIDTIDLRFSFDVVQNSDLSGFL